MLKALCTCLLALTCMLACVHAFDPTQYRIDALEDVIEETESRVRDLHNHWIYARGKHLVNVGIFDNFVHVQDHIEKLEGKFLLFSLNQPSAYLSSMSLP